MRSYYFLLILFKRKKYFSRKNPTAGLPGISKLIDSVISKRQGDQKEHSCLEKKFNFIKYFFISQKAYNAEKTLQLKIKKNEYS